MPQPTTYDVHVNRPLTNITIAHLQEEDAFAAPTQFPLVPVQKRSDLYFIYKREDFFRDEMAPRGAASESAGSGYNLSTGSYECVKYALHKDIDDDTRANEDTPLQSDRDAAIWLGQSALIKLERVWAAAAFTTGVWTGSAGTNGGAAGSDLTGDAVGTAANHFKQWDQAGSTPIEDIRAQIVNLTLTGINPKDLVLTMGIQVWQKLADNSELVGRLSYNDLRIFTEDKLAALLGIRQVKVVRSVYNSAAEGETGAYSFIFGKNALLTYTPAAPALMTPSAGYTFIWRGYLAGQGGSGMIPGQDRLRGCATVSKFRMPALKADRIEAELAFVPVITGPEMGVFFSSAVS